MSVCVDDKHFCYYHFQFVSSLYIIEIVKGENLILKGSGRGREKENKKKKSVSREDELVEESVLLVEGLEGLSDVGQRHQGQTTAAARLVGLGLGVAAAGAGAGAGVSICSTEVTRVDTQLTTTLHAG